MQFLTYFQLPNVWMFLTVTELIVLKSSNRWNFNASITEFNKWLVNALCMIYLFITPNTIPDLISVKYRSNPAF